jgi:glycosyltransferase involved in cell wall biosynthesis
LFSGEWKSPGLARNFGIENSKEEWVIFWDSDDIPNLLEVYLALQELAEECELLVGDFETVNSKGIVRSYRSEGNLVQLGLNPGLWRILIKRELIGKTLFTSQRMAEDQVFLEELLIKIPIVLFTNRQFYKYFIGEPTQLTRQVVALRDLRKVVQNIAEPPINLPPKIRLAIQLMHIRQLGSFWKRFPISGASLSLRMLHNFLFHGGVKNNLGYSKAFLIFFRSLI